MINPLDLSDRTFLVTGASSGIGRSTAGLLSRLGGRIILAGRDSQRLQETLSTLEGGRQHIIESFDLGRLDAIPDWLTRVVDVTGPLHGFVHCAGVDSLIPLRGMTTANLDQVMRINFHSAAIITKEFSRKKIRQAGSSIVLVASVAGLVGVNGRAAYCASKGALIAFAKSAALELARLDVRVNCLAPAYVRTQMYEAALGTLTPEQLARVVSTQPLGLGEPIDVSYAIAFLLADTARWVTGTVLTIDGGYTAQ